jgi:hypothetical protein
MIDQASTYAGSIDNLIILIAVLTGSGSSSPRGLLLAPVAFRAKPGREERVRHRRTRSTSSAGSPSRTASCSSATSSSSSARSRSGTTSSSACPRRTRRSASSASSGPGRSSTPARRDELDTADDIFTVDELHVEVDKTLPLPARVADVLHSFSVPVFRSSRTRSPAARSPAGSRRPTGEYDIQCAEICGIGHGLMGARIHIETPEQHAPGWREHRRVPRRGRRRR